MKKYFGILAGSLLSLSIVVPSMAPALAHDGGHGPKLTEQGKQGGIVSSVVAAKDADHGTAADLIYKSELVRSDDGTVRVYLYNKDNKDDKEMKPLDLSKFDKTASGVVSFKKKKKWVNASFKLVLEKDAFVAKAPKAGAKPYNVDVKLKEAGKELLTAFDNLD